MRAEVLPQRSDVVLPDWPVQTRQGQDHVARPPHQRPERQAPQRPRRCGRAGQDAENTTPTDAVTPVHDVVGKRRPACRELAPEYGLEQSFAEFARRRRIVPIVETHREFPRQRTTLATAAPVTVKPHRVHGRGPHRPREHAAHQRLNRPHPISVKALAKAW